MNKVLKYLGKTLSSLALLALLAGCGNPASDVKTSQNTEVSQEAAPADKTGLEKITEGRPTVAYRIQADYELIETGEPINFDYMVRCTNIDVPGSFHPVISGETSFKALSTGAAVSIAAPFHYCKRALRGQPFNKPGDLFKMPILGWFDDVNDMSRAWGYLTNDAYKSPLAKVKFVDFKVTRASADEYVAWAQKTSREYKQVGAIPGPFGCMTSNAHVTEPESCAHADRLARNNGKAAIMFNGGPTEPHVIASPLSYEFKTNTGRLVKDFDPETVRKFYVPNGESYGCNGRENNPQYQPVPEEVKGFANLQDRTFYNRKAANKVTYLDPVCLKGEAQDCDIQGVYPRIIVHIEEVKGRSNNAIVRILRSPDYRGFSLQKIGLGFPSDFGEGSDELPDYPKDGYSHFYVGDDHVCKSAGLGLHFFDFQANEYYRTFYHY